ncbi:hypothetical protein TNCT1_67870 [Streptomyces sp. 1-11]|nr:hypothetical protein TNCT1_67870 [Streptomyces sp. 1-11]
MFAPVNRALTEATMMATTDTCMNGFCGGSLADCPRFELELRIRSAIAGVDPGQPAPGQQGPRHEHRSACPVGCTPLLLLLVSNPRQACAGIAALT